jgi:hypothetical protein
VGPPPVHLENPGARQPQRKPSATAALSNGEEVRALLSAERAGPQTPAGAPPASRVVRTPLSLPRAPISSFPTLHIADLTVSSPCILSRLTHSQMPMTDSCVHGPGRRPSHNSSIPGSESALTTQRRASSNSAEWRPRGSVTFAPDVVSPPASRVRLHKEARRHSEEMLADEAADLADRFGAVASNKPLSPAVRRSSAQAQAATGQRRSTSCTSRNE